MVTIYDDYGFVDGCGFYVMEMLEGELLSTRIERCGSDGLPFEALFTSRRLRQFQSLFSSHTQTFQLDGEQT